MRAVILGKPYAPAWSVDALDAIATFVEEGDVLLLRRVTLAHGFTGSYIAIVERQRDSHVVAEARHFDRFVEAIGGLEPAHHALLALTPERLASLAMLDELRGLYATGELAAARRLAERCVRDLAEAFEIAEIATDLPSPLTREPARLGRLCESALAAFLYDPSAALGRVRQLCALAADLDGGPRSPLETRPNRGREAFASVSAAERFETLALPIAITHPAEAVEVSAIPLVPAVERPGLFFPARDRYARPTSIPHPVTEQYARIEEQIARIVRLTALDAPPALRDEQAFHLKDQVDELAELTRAELDLLALDGWGMKGRRRPCALWNPSLDRGDAPARPPTVVWLTEERIAVARDNVARVISLATGAVLREIALGGAQLQACDDTGRYLVTTGKVNRIAAGTAFDGFGCVDVETGNWLPELPDAIPAVVLLENDSAEDFDEPFLLDVRHAVSFSVGALLAAARGNRAALLSANPHELATHGIRALDTLLEEVSYKVLAARRDDVDVPTLRPDGTLVHDVRVKEAVALVMEDRWADRYGEAVTAAIAYTDRWRFVLPNLHVGDVDATWFHLGWPIDAVSFSPDGRRLAVVADNIAILDLATRSIESHIP